MHDEISLPSDLGDYFGCKFYFKMELPSGEHTYKLESNDGSLLSTGSRTLVNHDGMHACSQKSATATPSGEDYVLTYFQYGKAKCLRAWVDGTLIQSTGNEPAPEPAPAPAPEPAPAPAPAFTVSRIKRRCASVTMGTFRKVADVNFNGLNVVETMHDEISLPSDLGDYFGCKFYFKMELPSGEHTYKLESNDGSLLSTGSRTLVNHDGMHACSQKSATATPSGEDYVLTYFQYGKAKCLRAWVDGQLIQTTGNEPVPAPEPAPEPGPSPSPCDGGTKWEERNGVVMIEAENIDFRSIDEKWTLEQKEGESYIEYEKYNNWEGVYKIDEVGKLCYPVSFKSTGLWSFEYKNINAHNTEHNDAFIMMKDVPWLVVRNGEDPKVSWNQKNIGIKYQKAYRNRNPGTWLWDTHTIDHDAHKFYFKVDSPFSTEVCLAGRSTKFGVGKLLMYHIDTVPAWSARETSESLSCQDSIPDTTFPSEPSPGLYPDALWQGKGRIAQSYDGNIHDKDDWAAVPYMWAILAAAGLQNKVVHVDYNNHLGTSYTNWEKEMTNSSREGASLFGFDNTRIYDDITQLSASVRSLKNECDMSTSDDPLFIIAAGPMETVWRSIAESQATKRKHVYVISHHWWNDGHYHAPNVHRKQDVQALGINWIQITDQNVGFKTGSMSDFTWLRNGDPKYEWLYDRIETSGKPDVSDAGMLYWLITGDMNGNVQKSREFMGL